MNIFSTECDSLRETARLLRCHIDPKSPWSGEDVVATIRRAADLMEFAAHTIETLRDHATDNGRLRTIAHNMWDWMKCDANKSDATEYMLKVWAERLGKLGVEVGVTPQTPPQKEIEGLQAERQELSDRLDRLVALLAREHNIDASWDGLRHYWTIQLTEEGRRARDETFDTKRENADMRNLLRKLWAGIKAFGDTPYYLEVPGNNPAIVELRPDWTWIDECETALRDLGIEVDE